MEWDVYKFFGLVAVVSGLGEWRYRWLKSRQDESDAKMDGIEHELIKNYMTKEETVQMYGMLNAKNDAKLDSVITTQVGLDARLRDQDKKLDKIIEHIMK